MESNIQPLQNETNLIDFASLKQGKIVGAIIHKAKAGDEEARRRLFDMHCDYVLNISLGYTRDMDDAKDMTQEVFVKVFTSLDSLQDPSKFKSWVTTITRNTCISFLRTRKKEVSQLHIYKKDIESDQNMKEEEPKSSNVSVQTVYKLIHDIKKSDIRETVSEFYLNNMKVEEIAHRQGVPVSTVTTRLNRFRVQVRKQLLLNSVSDGDSG